MATKNKYEYTSTQIVAATCSHCCDATSPLPPLPYPSFNKKTGRKKACESEEEGMAEGGGKWAVRPMGTQNGKRKCG